MGWLKNNVPWVMGAIQAAIALLIAFGLDLTSDQTAAILGVSAALLAVVTHSQVSPKAPGT